MELLAQTRIAFWEGGSLWLVEARPADARVAQSTDFHAHHALQIVIGLGGRFRLSTHSEAVSDRPVAVAPDIPHRFEAEGLFALIFVEPESRAGRAIAARLFTARELAEIDSQMLDDFVNAAPAAVDDEALARAGREAVERVAGDLHTWGLPDFRVRRVVDWARRQMAERAVGISEAAPVAGLSPGRLRHLFVEQTGLPFKTYLLWLRLQRAVEQVNAGASRTDAAHGAGFADSAHLSRTFRRMFGVAPTNLRMT
jgi:AraC-like DNA-binding protein